MTLCGDYALHMINIQNTSERRVDDFNEQLEDAIV